MDFSFKKGGFDTNMARIYILGSWASTLDLQARGETTSNPDSLNTCFTRR